ncbi:MAG TPA: PIN domain-containing protein [Dongiaceae bacterium]|nr:PIN domain-containing protein [Dongiaceae bacterium]
MMAERFSLDTDILVSAADSKAGAKHARAVALLHGAAAADCILTVQVLTEFFQVVTRGGVPAKAAAALVEDWRVQFPVVAAEAPQLSAAIDQAARRRAAFWDALLLETVRAAGCRILLSGAFPHGRSQGGLLVLDPFHAAAAQRLQRLLG